MTEKELEPLSEKELPEDPEMDSVVEPDQEKDAVLQAIDELADRAHEIEKLNEELSQTTDQLKRQAAEFQNYRRRTEQEKAQAVSLGKSIVVQNLLDIVDDFERSLEATEKAEAEVAGDLSSAYQSLKSGVELVYQKVMGDLEKLGVVPIESIGQPFNEDVHEAMMQQPAAEGEVAGIVVNEIQRGYRMGDRILRHARVIVST